MAKNKSDQYLYYTLGILIIVMIGIMIIPKFFEKKATSTPRTYDDEVKKAYTEGQNDQRIIYNGFVFVKDGPLWRTQVKNPQTNELLNFAVRYNPYEVENVSIEGNINDSFRTGTVYLTFDPYSSELQYTSLAAAELTLNLARGMNMDVEAACMSEHPDCVNKSIIRCNNTELPVIELVQDDNPKLFMKGNCMRISGKEFDLLRAVDRVIFEGYGIMDT